MGAYLVRRRPGSLIHRPLGGEPLNAGIDREVKIIEAPEGPRQAVEIYSKGRSVYDLDKGMVVEAIELPEGDAPTYRLEYQFKGHDRVMPHGLAIIEVLL